MQRWWFHLLLFVATLLSVFVAYLINQAAPPPYTADQLIDAALFSACALLILGSHEMGHWLMARAHNVESTLPYFIPFPLAFGTLGAVIRLKGRIPTKNALVDIGAAGPLAGLLVAIPLLFAGLSLSQVVELPSSIARAPVPAYSGIGIAMSVGDWLREVVNDLPSSGPSFGVPLFGDNLLMLGATRLVLGPLSASADVAVHPVAMAAWFGMLITMLNLLPVGQLDGGHLTYALFGLRAKRLGELVALALLLLGFFCSVSWFIWFFIVTRVVGFEHPPVVAESEPLSRSRKIVSGIGLLFTVLTFMPVPMDVLTW